MLLTLPNRAVVSTLITAVGLVRLAAPIARRSRPPRVPQRQPCRRCGVMRFQSRELGGRSAQGRRARSPDAAHPRRVSWRQSGVQDEGLGGSPRLDRRGNSHFDQFASVHGL